MLLVCNTVAPLAANALPLNSGSGDGMFLPIPRQLLPTSYHGMSTSMPDPNSIQVSPHSNITLTPIPHELSSRSHPSMNTSISNPNNVQFLPSSNLNIRNGSDRHHYNNGVNNTGVAGFSPGHQPSIAGLMGLLSGQNSNANQPNNAGLMGMLSGQNSNANQPNNAGPIGSHTGKAVVMGKSYPSWRLPS